MINVQGLYIQYGDRVLFNRPSLTIEKNEKIALIGRNGAGKSSLLKLLCGKFSPDEGSINIQNGVSLGYLEQDLDLNYDTPILDEAKKAFEQVNKLKDELEEINQELETGIEDMDLLHKLLEKQADLFTRIDILGGNTLESEAEKILLGLGFKSKDLNRKLSEFSGGWQMRVEIAKLLLRKPEVLLLDEPTNHLDIESIIWLEKYLKNYEGNIILISHDTQFLDTICNKTIEIDNGVFYEYKASYYKYIALREERITIQEAAYKNQQKDIEQKEKIIKKFMAKATKTKMAQSMQKQLDKVERISIDAFNLKDMDLRFPKPQRSGRLVVDANCSKNYGPIKVLEDIHFELERGQKVAFVGQNGQGKSTLAKLIVGNIEATSGKIELGHNVEIGYYAQNQAEELDRNKTLLETMEDNASPEQRPKLRSILGSFLFSGEDVDKKVSVLSGGERARLALAIMVLREFNLLILDEPTNHLDIQAKAVLKDTVMNYEGTCIIVSHDRDFLNGLTDKTFEFRDNKIIEYLGDVNYFLDKRALDNMRDVEQVEVIKEKAAKKEISSDDLKKMKRKVQYLERDIEKLEESILKLQNKMYDPEFYQDPEKDKILAKHGDLKKELEDKMKEWELKAEELDAFV
ncbi:ABC-F family ATP-binding cassette domain-containing protein [Portibacter lacus]|uniref:Glycosyl transferase family 2 n=1 Tax=Portibacter lacus TaxID=1099794 RepID=A0AA37SUP1_9BACT|nr:ABC-F family ATP-binding cassette domain-containing protein [Portibacter lacus]GLR18335.1 glycosyl transferase family 2 [Portibacter lacus]